MVASNNHREKLRRVSGKNNHRPRPDRQRSFTRDIEHVAAETYLITRLAFTLLQYLGNTKLLLRFQ
ncbi:isoprenylcysteine alpha-carbonyl methylesterase ICME-like [Trifolium medium]|uniref:Isoprenylcysteine alpha-carbonyl methylesterase ICME-like n=1 Tax=Trifolium medium TaxID=97028 RepID=A0A392PGY4_9FABA|nr:isoprenylcysteine alpha-carbonyl methylesterase ICME-like [Trifolium medium]